MHTQKGRFNRDHSLRIVSSGKQGIRATTLATVKLLDPGTTSLGDKSSASTRQVINL